MLLVTLTQVSAIGFCGSTTEVFVGYHEVEGHSDCSHSHKEEASSDCSDEQEPCGDQHLEFDIEVDDFIRSTSEDSNAPSDEYVCGLISFFSAENFFGPREPTISSGFARPPPDIPVYLRFGVMRL